MGDLDREHGGSFVVVATVATLQQADVIRAVLEMNDVPATIPGEYATNTLAHVGMGLNPHGVRVSVASRDEQKAREILDREHAGGPDVEDWPKAQPEQTLPEDFARRACWAALLSWFFPLILPAAVYNFVKALRAAGRGCRQVEDREIFQRRMTIAVLLALLAIAVWVALPLLGAYGLLAGWAGI